MSEFDAWEFELLTRSGPSAKSGITHDVRRRLGRVRNSHLDRLTPRIEVRTSVNRQRVFPRRSNNCERAVRVSPDGSDHQIAPL